MSSTLTMTAKKTKTADSPERYPEVPVGPRLQAVLTLAYRARRAVLLEGPTGIGKSEVVQHTARKLGIASTVLDLSLLEPPDLVGLPVLENQRTSFAVPRILPTEGSGILMLEELNRAERYIQQPALQLLTARKLHEYELPPGWVCFAAINPEAGDYQVTPLDRALRARFLTVPVRADRVAWVGWAVEQGVHAAVVALVREHERALEDVPPRTWVYVSHVLKALNAEELNDEILLRDALGGYLPVAWCERLLATRTHWSTGLGLDPNEFLRTYSAGDATSQTIRGWKEQGRTDKLDELTQRTLAFIKGPDVALRERFSLESFEALLADLPGDQREKLQDTLARNRVATNLLELRPSELLQNYRNSAGEKTVKAWIADPFRQHRVSILVTLLCAYIEAQARGASFKQNNAVRISLGHLLAQLGEKHGLPLVDMLRKQGITPVRPS